MIRCVLVITLISVIISDSSPPCEVEEVEVNLAQQRLQNELNRKLRGIFFTLNSECPARGTLLPLKLDKLPSVRQDDLPSAAHIKRKDLRQMTRKEINNYAKAVRIIKDKGIYDTFALYHTAAMAAHAGLAFLPWHRHYLYLYESALRREVPDVTIPYWDSSIDFLLPNATHAVIWTGEFLGNMDGVVTTGPFKNWPVIFQCRNISHYLKRQTNIKEGNSNLYSAKKIAEFRKYKSFRQLLSLVLIRNTTTTGGISFNYSKFEAYHGGVHCFVGTCLDNVQPSCYGHMGCVACSANDPMFYMHHGFVDYLWWEWERLPGRDQSYPDIAELYPDYYDCPFGRIQVPCYYNSSQTELMKLGGHCHRPLAPMQPFLDPTVQNIRGMRKDFYAVYEKRPSNISCELDADCKSPLGLLWCHKCQCWSKIQKGGDCSNLPDKACYCPDRPNKPQKIPKCVRSTCKCQ